MNLLQCIGIGTVASTKETNSDEIMFYLPNLFPTAEGRITSDVKESESTSLGLDGEENVNKTLKSNAIPAKWTSIGDSNRITPPDVREGTKVAIYKVDGQNTHYWTTWGVNATTFRLETVIYGFSGNPNTGENTEFDVDDFYIFKVSTHEGKVGLRTSKKNGEATIFDVQLDAMEGVFTLAAENKTYFVIDDVKSSFTYTNASDTVFMIEKENGTFFSKGDLSLFTEKSMNIKTEVLNVDIKELNADINVTNWKGLFNHTGDMIQKGNQIQTGDRTQTGKQDVSGLITSQTDVVAGEISLKKHKTSGVQGGSGISSVPVP